MIPDECLTCVFEVQSDVQKYRIHPRSSVTKTRIKTSAEREKRYSHPCKLHQYFNKLLHSMMSAAKKNWGKITKHAVHVSVCEKSNTGCSSGAEMQHI